MTEPEATDTLQCCTRPITLDFERVKAVLHKRCFPPLMTTFADRL